MRMSCLSKLAGQCFGLPTLVLVVGVGNTAFRVGQAESDPGAEAEAPLAADPEHLEGCPTCRLIRAMDDRLPRRFRPDLDGGWASE